MHACTHVHANHADGAEVLYCHRASLPKQPKPEAQGSDPDASGLGHWTGPPDLGGPVSTCARCGADVSVGAHFWGSCGIPLSTGRGIKTRTLPPCHSLTPRQAAQDIGCPNPPEPKHPTTH